MIKKDYPPLVFGGDIQKLNVSVTRNGVKEELDNYIPDGDLVKAVNLALLLEKPLLVLGEPGCGKSLLAKAIAYDIYKENMYAYYREWHIKSTSKAKEGLYEFDYVHRLRDATLPGHSGQSIDISRVDKYIHFGPMGEAFSISNASDQRAVLLIDEIDKADIDFPNDLLNELDRMEFEIQEKKIEEKELKKPAETPATGAITPATGEAIPATDEAIPVKVKAAFRPIVIITSNSEKELPDAFLRRCIFHYIEPLSEARLKDIVVGRYYGKKTEDPLIDKALGVFVRLRETIKNELLSIGKNVSTSEFLNWFEALKHYNTLSQQTDGNRKESINALINELSKLDTPGQIPLKNILLKNKNSVIRFDEKKPAI